MGGAVAKLKLKKEKNMGKDLIGGVDIKEFMTVAREFVDEMQDTLTSMNMSRRSVYVMDNMDKIANCNKILKRIADDYNGMITQAFPTEADQLRNDAKKMLDEIILYMDVIRKECQIDPNATVEPSVTATDVEEALKKDTSTQNMAAGLKDLAEKQQKETGSIEESTSITALTTHVIITSTQTFMLSITQQDVDAALADYVKQLIQSGHKVLNVCEVSYKEKPFKIKQTVEVDFGI